MTHRNNINHLWRLKSYLKPGLFIFNDLKSLCGLWELDLLDTANLDDEQLAETFKRIQMLLDQLPQSDPEWILQFYLRDTDEIQDTCKAAEATQSKLSQDLAAMNQQHISRGVSSLWEDTKVTGLPYRFRSRECYCLFYRTNPSNPSASALSNSSDERHIVNFGNALKEVNLNPRVVTYAQAVNWLSQWLTDAKSKMLDGSGSESYGLGVQCLLQGSMLANIPHMVLSGSSVRIDKKHQSFRIGKLWHRFIRLIELKQQPVEGLFTAERAFSHYKRVLWDSFSSNEQLCITVVASSQNKVKLDIRHALDAVKGQSSIASTRRNICNQALERLENGMSVHSVSVGIFTKDKSKLSLDKRCQKIVSKLSNSELQIIPFEQDCFQTDHWLMHLPGNFDVTANAKWYRRVTRLWHSQHIARILPIYGSYYSKKEALQSNQGAIPFFNRSGQLISIDPIQMKVRNAHTVILGSTGVGKTALLIHKIIHIYAKHRPKLFLISTLPTFDRLISWLEQYQQSVFQLKLRSGSGTHLSLFSNAKKAADLLDSNQKLAKGNRDIIGETEVIAELLMTGQDITQPWEKELLVGAILEAGRKSQSTGILISDVVRELAQLSKRTDIRPMQADKAVQLEATLKRYTRGLAGDIFNQPSKALPDVDCTILDLGVSAKKGYEHIRTLAYISFLSHIHSLVENNQTGRPTIVITDEAHIVISQENLGGYMASMTAQWRTYGAWNWLITQNLRQFGKAAKQILSLTEWWWILSTNQDEVENLKRFANLSKIEEEMLFSCAKIKHKYVEGVLLSDTIRTRFRSVPARLSLALSLTDPDEKAAIESIANTQGISHTQASLQYLDSLHGS